MTARRPARPAGRAFRPLRSLRALARRAFAAYAETAWVYRYGPGFAPTAPVRFTAGEAAPRPAARPYVVRASGAPRQPQQPRQPSGFRAPGRGGRRDAGRAAA